MAEQPASISRAMAEATPKSTSTWPPTLPYEEKWVEIHNNIKNYALEIELRGVKVYVWRLGADKPIPHQLRLFEIFSWTASFS